MNGEYYGPLTSFVVLYAVASAASMAFSHGIVGEKRAASMAKTNMASFNALPAGDPRVALNEPSRINGWEAQQRNIAADIVRNRQPGWDWLPFMGYRFDLSSAMRKANVSILPHRQPGLPAMLVVDKEHGCLLVDYENTARESADQARALLDAFKARATEHYDYLGTYVVNARNERQIAVDYTAEGKASDHCPKATAPAGP